ncbi:hypothetical protein OIU85_005525 [Salix viminalis]|uniref:Reverse transcriptase domain-containing protein n=1 Tax=Salix viminalis TaxID=40686 RepID=A0A9Q0PJ25_SALVM|nr:hypothetical protein OIU85_005525 [Salix viminalis]
MIRENQHVFVPGRLMADNALLALETFHCSKKIKRYHAGARGRQDRGEHWFSRFDRAAVAVDIAPPIGSSFLLSSFWLPPFTWKFRLCRACSW